MAHVTLPESISRFFNAVISLKEAARAAAGFPKAQEHAVRRFSFHGVGNSSFCAAGRR